ncbi:hypothetical protein LUZ60_015345 [Juncus effusus]|nr:hypothetical protein LUZ60_015345 [Juncus effusus]
METFLLLVVGLLQLLFFSSVTAQMPGFISLDCGGTDSYTDSTGLEWTPDNSAVFGQRANLSASNSDQKQYQTVRFFPADTRKYCYTLSVRTRTRYLVRATFLYGNFDNSNVYPKFDVSIGATHWSTIVIADAAIPEIVEMVVLATQPVMSVCLSNASTGLPFISTLELRQFNGSVYYTTVETQFYMSLAARINFGAESNDSIRYPDDPFDRIWQSDSVQKANYLVDVALGTSKISTKSPIYTGFDEMPPQAVMQTAVVGNNGSLTYRLDLEGFPANSWAFSYLAEIETLDPGESRKFKLFVPGKPEFSKVTINVQENAGGKNRLYEPGFWNVSLPFVFEFGLRKTNDSDRGPILNAMEIYKYLEINPGSLDANVMSSFVTKYPKEEWALEGGDPCLPASWTWVQCSSDSQPRIISIVLTGKGITGNIPSELTKLPGLVELHLDGNSFSGSIPDFSGSPNLEIIHLENNVLTGSLPSSLGDLPKLKELYVQNNKLSGAVPPNLLKKNIIFNDTGNTDLHADNNGKNTAVIILFTIIAAALLLVIIIACCLFVYRRRDSKLPIETNNITNNNTIPTRGTQHQAKKLGSYFSEVATESAHRFSLQEIELATDKFEKRIGSGGFGVVYYGKLTDGKEIAVKLLTNDSYQGIREFLNEVTLLSRIHHRNLVMFLGYSQQDGKNILVYEFMHNGTLKEHIRGSSNDKIVSWLKRLEIAEDSAKGIEYLHTGCAPTIIHRDLKSSNILLDKQMRAKVSDFGLSKPAVDGSHVSSIVRGTVGYLDPEYYISQQLTEKSDIYSFGVILLELISGHEPISNENFGINCRNIVAWARTHIESGNINAIIDQSLDKSFDIQSIWKIAEIAMMCVKPKGIQRPNISEILKEIQEAILIEKRMFGESVDVIGNKSLGSSANLDSFDDLLQPGLR